MSIRPTGEAGRLKIFLGYAPTVGKSHAMLDAAIRKKTESVEVVIGALDLELNTDLLPLINELQGQESQAPSRDLDLDAILARKPDLVVIDDLAYTNPPGYRHPRRYQDVDEILAAGIDVFSTLDVQELESLRDLIATILGNETIETIPDKIFKNASVIEFIDLPPEEIVQRLNHKIETGELSKEKYEPYLSISLLTHLREIALRRATGIVESSRPIVQPGRNREFTGSRERDNILVCISSHPLSERLVRTGKRAADENHSHWYVLYIETPERAIPIFPQRERLEKTLKLAEELGAVIVRKTALDVPSAIASFSRQNHISRIILGAPRKTLWGDWFGKTYLDRLIHQVGPVELVVITGDDLPIPLKRSSSPASAIPWVGFIKAVGVVALTTAVSFPLHFIFDPVNLVMFYLVAVMACSFFFGRGPGILASVLSVLAFDYFMVAPRFSLSVADSQYLLTFFGLFVTSLVVSGLAGQIRAQVDASRQREDHTSSLYTLSQELTNTYTLDSTIHVIINQIQHTFVRDCIIWVKSGNEIQPFAESEIIFTEDAEKLLVAWVLDNLLPAGRGTDTFPNSASSLYPMIVGNHAVGVLEVKGVAQTVLMNAEKRKLLEAYCGMAALAIERNRLLEDQKTAQLTIETERLQNALLNSISHDLRTPLATITGVLSSLRESEQPETGASPLDDQTRLELIDTGWEEADRLNHVVGNLLDISRLESGALKLNLQYGDLEGVVGAVLRHLKKRLESFKLQVTISADLPQIRFDPGLIEQVLYNLMDNAIKFSTTEKNIQITVKPDVAGVILSLQDQGRGIPEDEIDKIFDKFYRTKTASKVSGSGLGLSICKGIIQAHHGRIWAENKSPHGSIIWFTLPLTPEESPK